MKATTSPIYRWRVGEVEIIRVLEFEAALFEPAVIHPEVCAEIIERDRGPREHRHGAAFVLALRPWNYSGFKQFER